MRKVKVKYNYSRDSGLSEGFLFEGKKDISVVNSIIDGRIDSTSVDSESGDLNFAEKAVFRMSELKSQFNGDSVQSHIHPALKMYKETLFSMLERDEQVFMNPNGGLCPVEGTLTIIE